MANSFVQYNIDRTTNNFSVPFNYLSKSHISVTVSSTSTKTNPAFTWNSNSEIRISLPMSNFNVGDVLEIRRTTPRDRSLVDFSDGSILTETDLDTQTLQCLYIVQEAFDALDSAIRLDSDGSYDSGNRRIKNVADPVEKKDAVNKQYYEAVFEPKLNAIKAEAQAARDAAVVAKNDALGFRDTTEQLKNTTVTYKDQAGVFKDQAGQSAQQSDASAQLARRWAVERENVVVQNSEYSSYHWALQARAALAALPNTLPPPVTDSFLVGGSPATQYVLKNPAEVRQIIGASTAVHTHPEFINRNGDTVAGDITFDGLTKFRGNVWHDGTLSAISYYFDNRNIYFTKPVEIQSTLHVEGQVVLDSIIYTGSAIQNFPSGIYAPGYLTIGPSRTSGATINGPTTLVGSLNVRDAVNLTDGMTMGRNLVVNGTTTLNGWATVNNRLSATGAVVLDSTLNVGGTTQVNGDLYVNRSCSVTGSIITQGDLDVGGWGRVRNQLVVDSTLTAGGFVTSNITTLFTGTEHKFNVGGMNQKNEGYKIINGNNGIAKHVFYIEGREAFWIDGNGASGGAGSNRPAFFCYAQNNVDYAVPPYNNIGVAPGAYGFLRGGFATQAAKTGVGGNCIYVPEDGYYYIGCQYLIRMAGIVYGFGVAAFRPDGSTYWICRGYHRNDSIDVGVNLSGICYLPRGTTLHLNIGESTGKAWTTGNANIYLGLHGADMWGCMI